MAEREQNPFDTPVPGQSLTDAPGNYPWEHSPQHASVEDATHEIWKGLHKKEVLDNIVVLLDSGLTVEEIVKVIIFSGFVEGKFNPDVGILLTPIIFQMVAAIGKKAGVENIKLQKAKVDTTQQLIENILEQEPEEEISKPKDVKKGLMSKEKEDDK
jgi:hypothetical protein|tara:strand:+ start:251 stop:721 length:471 start_codon:yes stop_codon:yes gene_type:complete